MKTHTEKQLVKWAKSHGMGLDDRYPDSAVLTFQPDPNLDRFWETPPEPERRSYFLWVNNGVGMICVFSSLAFHEGEAWA